MPFLQSFSPSAAPAVPDERLRLAAQPLSPAARNRELCPGSSVLIVGLNAAFSLRVPCLGAWPGSSAFPVCWGSLSLSLLCRKVIQQLEGFKDVLWEVWFPQGSFPIKPQAPAGHQPALCLPCPCWWAGKHPLPRLPRGAGQAEPTVGVSRARVFTSEWIFHSKIWKVYFVVF